LFTKQIILNHGLSGLVRNCAMPVSRSVKARRTL